MFIENLGIRLTSGSTSLKETIKRKISHYQNGKNDIVVNFHILIVPTQIMISVQ